MERKPNELNYDEEMLQEIGATPVTANKAAFKGTSSNEEGKKKDENVYSWTTVKSHFPEEMRDRETIMNYVFGNLKRIGIDEPIAPDQPAGGEVCHELTYEEVLKDYKNPISHRDGTQWLVPKNYDAVFLTRETHFQVMEDMGRSLSLVFPAADCAIVRMFDKEKDVIGLTHSDLNHTSANVIGSMVNYMEEHFGSNPEDIIVWVGAFAHDGMIWDKIPPCAEKNPEEWEGYIKPIDDSHYEISYGDKIYDQIKDSGVPEKNIFFDMDNTITNEDYYSNNRDKRLGNKEGRNLMGITFDGLPVYESIEQGKSKARLK